MAGRLSVEERLSQVHRLRDLPDLAEARPGLEKALGDTSNLVVAEAAKIVADYQLAGFEAALLAAWRRFVVDPIKTDKGCRAKKELIAALNAIQFDDADFFLEGIKYSQLEPAWGGPEDTAVDVRGGCAFGLAASRQLRPVRKLVALVDLLLCPGRLDRRHAVQAMAEVGSDAAIPLVRYRLLSGDEADVQGACMAGLLKLAPADSLAVVVPFLDSPAEDPFTEAAAALGECGHLDAVEALIGRAGNVRQQERLRTLLAGIGLCRQPRAVDFLIEFVAAGGKNADLAVQALRPACVYPDVRERLRSAVEAAGIDGLKMAFDRMISG